MNQIMLRHQDESSGKENAVVFTRNQAAARVATLYPTECAICDPNADCHDKTTINNNGNNHNDHRQSYWRMDQVGPTILHGTTPVASHLLGAFRLPAHLAKAKSSPAGNDDETTLWNEFLANSSNLVPQAQYYFEYNPSIVPLPADQVPASLRAQQNDKNASRSASPSSHNFYLALLRVSAVQQCLTDDQRFRLGRQTFGIGSHKEFMAFIIMDANLRPLQQSIVKHGLVYDHRLFLLNDDQLYLGFNHQLTPLWINRPATVPVGHTLSVLPPAPSLFLTKPNDFWVSVRAHPIVCCTSPACRGKNFNYFVVPGGGGDGNGDEIYVELKPSHPRIVERMPSNLLSDNAPRCTLPNNLPLLQSEEEVAMGEMVGASATKANASLLPPVYVTHDNPPESFATVDEVYFGDYNYTTTAAGERSSGSSYAEKLPYSTERGNACCIRIPDPRRQQLETASTNMGAYLLVGVSHSKVVTTPQEMWDRRHQDPNLISFGAGQYAHRFYAFAPRPPFGLVAQSGKFCFGFPAAAEAELDNSNVHFLYNRVYHLNHTDFACPKIEFVLSMSETVDDYDKVIVGYGLNE